MIKLIKLLRICFILFFLQSIMSCVHAEQKTVLGKEEQKEVSDELILGIRQMGKYLPLLKGKRVGLVANHTSQIAGKHLVDSLLDLGIDMKFVFSPEHGFRGKADAGEKVKNGVDPSTGIPVISLYGDNKKPTKTQLANIDVLVFDIQDVGVRFYTYISTLHYVMEAAAENNVPLIVLDRPNPNGHYVDGPILDVDYRSFVGLHPVPIVHGMTIGEYARMINGEKWLKAGVQCELTVISCQNYQRDQRYILEERPSPNLPNERAIYLYPSLCLFEGTAISVGRGTEFPFQQIGAPKLEGFDHHFTPAPGFGAKKPKYEGKKCLGLSFNKFSIETIRERGELDLSYLILMYQKYPDKAKFFTEFFNLLAGNSSLQKAIKDGKSEETIKAGWEDGIQQFVKMREAYLLYP